MQVASRTCGHDMSATCIPGSVKCVRPMTLRNCTTYLVDLAIRSIAHNLNQLKDPGRVLGKRREKGGKKEGKRREKGGKKEGKRRGKGGKKEGKRREKGGKKEGKMRGKGKRNTEQSKRNRYMYECYKYSKDQD